jgi:glyoxylase-like metal-dependent hydrolase (beta-lactamase superfamily II)
MTAAWRSLGAAGEWLPTLLEVGSSRHPGAWVGPGFPDWMWSPSNALLLRGPSGTILVDTGSGPLVGRWPFEGARADVVAALAREGVEPDDVDTVVLTHLDDDHVGGVFEGAWPDVRPVFKRATLVAPRASILGATDGSAAETSEAAELLLATGRLVDVEDGYEVASGIALRSAPGHRAGHSVLYIDGENPLVHLADAVHHLAHVAHPEWDKEADSEPATALATRRRLLEEAANSGARLVASHIPGPRAFRVVRRGAGYETETII